MPLSDTDIKLQTRGLWKSVFADSEAFMDMYFSKKYVPAANVVCLEENTVVASGQWLPYDTLLRGQKSRAAYLSGLATHPDYRGKGYAATIISEGLKRLYSEEVPLAWLIPANAALRKFYEKPTHGSFSTVAFRTECRLAAEGVVGANFEVVAPEPSVALTDYLRRALSAYQHVLLPSLRDVQAAFSLCEMEQGKAALLRQAGEFCGLALVVKDLQDGWRLSFMEAEDTAAEAALLAALAAATGSQTFRFLQPAIQSEGRTQPYGMARVVNVERFLQTIKPTLSKHSFCVEIVDDEILPQNNGRYLFSTEGVERTEQPADTKMTPGELAAFFLKDHAVSMPMMLDE